MHQLVRFITTLLINSTRVYVFNLTGKQTEIIRSKIQNFSLDMVVESTRHIGNCGSSGLPAIGGLSEEEEVLVSRQLDSIGEGQAFQNDMSCISWGVVSEEPPSCFSFKQYIEMVPSHKNNHNFLAYNEKFESKKTLKVLVQNHYIFEHAYVDHSVFRPTKFNKKRRREHGCSVILTEIIL